ncbi:hypothetical protein HAX54_003266 [Datura stramonium]|uniref:Uncharacterized protein n=1 Tax=Datura stramonium TaxID=4076 RepID=A0ABS8T543_DATST|nr:hypothetical protein [Datura stramonium]
MKGIVELAPMGLGEAKLVQNPSKIARDPSSASEEIIYIKVVMNDIAVNYNMEEQDVAGIIKGMLLGPDAYCTTHQVTDETQQDFIIHDQQAEVDNTTSLMHGEHYLSGGNQINDQILWNSTYEATMEKQNTTWISTTLEQEAYGQIEQLQRHGADDIGSNDFWETMNGILGDN